MNRWRDDGFFDLIDSRPCAGRFSVKRDFDEKRGQYLLLAAFERESDASALADSIGAETVARYSGYASQRGFKYSAKFDKALTAAKKRQKPGKKLEVAPGNRPA